MATPKLVVVVGETASGKSALGLRLAQQFNGEIICADSSTLRRGLDIGAAKPSQAEQALVKHHLLDIIGPDEKFTAAQFQKLANEAIKDIARRGKLPVMVGGSGLYIDGVIYNYQFFGPKAEAVDRREPRQNTLVLGLKTERDELKERIERRVDQMLGAGLEDEVRGLKDRYGWPSEALKGVGYAQWHDYFLGSESRAQVRQKIIRATLGLAKRQRTWFKRNNSIQWISTPVKWDDVVARVTTFLS